jgi:hypothetical protein
VLDSRWDEQGVACATPKSANNLRVTSDSYLLSRTHQTKFLLILKSLPMMP